MFAQEFCFYNLKRYSIKTNTFHYNSLLPLQRIADTWMSVKVPYGVNNKGADQSARMRRLVCACDVRKPPKTGFLATGPNYDSANFLKAAAESIIVHEDETQTKKVRVQRSGIDTIKYHT